MCKSHEHTKDLIGSVLRVVVKEYNQQVESSSKNLEVRFSESDFNPSESDEKYQIMIRNNLKSDEVNQNQMAKPNREPIRIRLSLYEFVNKIVLVLR